MKKKITIKEAKEKIQSFEYYTNGLEHLNGSSVKVVNVKIGKDVIIADVILLKKFGEVQERYNNSEYAITLFQEK